MDIRRRIALRLGVMLVAVLIALVPSFSSSSNVYQLKHRLLAPRVQRHCMSRASRNVNSNFSPGKEHQMPRLIRSEQDRWKRTSKRENYWTNHRLCSTQCKRSYHEQNVESPTDTVACGQVTTSYSEVLRVLVNVRDLPQHLWDLRREQLQAAKAVAEKAGELEDAAMHEAALNSPKCGTMELQCVIRKVLKKAKVKIMVGDQVEISTIDWIQNSGMVVGVSERKIELMEPKVANADLALLVFAMQTPDPSVELMTRFTVSLSKAGIPFLIVMNKCETVDEATRLDWEDRIKAWGHKAFLVSVKNGEGLDDLRNELRGKVTVLCGPSGVGKSSIINWMLTDGFRYDGSTSSPVDVSRDVLGKGGRGRARGRDADDLVKNSQLQSVQSVSARSGSGKQTTRTVSLVRLPSQKDEDDDGKSDGSGSGLLADTPGFSKATLSEVRSTDLAACFPEISSVVEKLPCKFSDCKHIDEPGCSVGKDWERYDQYLALLEELEEEEEIMKKKGKFRTAGEAIEKAKDSAKGKRTEFKLKSKRYRKENRRTARQNIGNEFM
mmetsp:Transcript_46833/g.77767  ORF Transcript_46833/g.77767 Transcript_46833/m.77767 type:complete len:552 (+) Transcript_46833:85-1740(+)